MKDSKAEQGTSQSGYEEKGPYHCEDCIHRQSSDSDLCIHPKVVSDPALKSKLVTISDGKQAVRVNLEYGCCKYVNQERDLNDSIFDPAAASLGGTEMKKVTGLAKAVDQAHRNHPPGQHPTSIKYGGEEYALGESMKDMRDNETEFEEAMEPTHEESEEVEECGQPLDVSKLPYTREHDYIVSRTNGAKYEVKFGPQDKGNVPANPFASLAQEGYLHAHPEKLGKEKLAEFDAATKGKKLPYKVKKGK